MSTQVSFIGSGFSLQSVAATLPARVRVRFTQDPKQASALVANDGLRPQNYSITGPGPAAVASVSIVSGDPQSLDLNLVAPLTRGTWLLTVTNIQTALGASLSAPTSMSFEVTAQTNVTDLNAGAEYDSPARIIRKHLAPSMAGPNWDALIEALSQGDDFNWTNARLAFDQLFKASASGKYLDRLAANDGLNRPEGVGMGDELFRLLATRLTNNKITHEALREILEVFYGQDALRAYAETSLEEPFALVDGQELFWTLDENQLFRYAVQPTDYTLVGSARGAEVAAALTKAMRDAGGTGFAAAVQNPETGGIRVRIYSGSLGLKSFVRVTGGTAQPGLHFPAYRTTYTGAIPGPGYTWTVSNPDQSVTRFSLTTTGMPVIDISSVEAGDYVVIGAGAAPLPHNSFPVKAVGFSWSGGDITQTFDVDADLDYAGSFVQDLPEDFQFFHPEKRTILAGARTVVVAQTVPRTVNIQIPATTQAVNRTPHSAAYARVQAALDVKRYVRDGSGQVTLDVEAPFGTIPSAGNQFFLDGVVPANGRPWVSAGTPGTSPAVGTSDASFGTTWSATQVPPAALLEHTEGARLANNDLLLAGGLQTAVGTPTARAFANRFRLVGSVTVTDASEAQGALRRSYQWIATANMNTARWMHQLTKLNDGRVLASGGADAAGTHTATSELYDPNADTWTNLPNMSSVRANHQQVVLANGKVLAIAGSTGVGNAAVSVDIFDPATLAWTVGPSLVLRRQSHRAVRLLDGRVMVTGGCSTYPYAIANTLNSVEIYDPVLNTWSDGPPMTVARSNHQLLLLADGRVLAFGGRGRHVDRPTPSVDGLNSAEIYDPKLNRWHPAPSTQQVWSNASTAVLNGRLFVAAGDYAVTEAIESQNRSTLQWNAHFLRDTAHRDRMFDLGGIALLTGGQSPSFNTYTTADLLIPGADAVSGGAFNGPHEVLTAGASSVTFKTPEQPFYTSNVGNPSGPGGTTFDTATGTYLPGAGYAYSLQTAQRASNITTLTLLAGKTTAGLAVGQRVFVNLNGSTGFTPGWQTLTTVGSTTVAYSDPGGNLGPSAVTGAVDVDLNPNATLTLSAAPVQSVDAGGPYIYDPDDGLAVTGVETALTVPVQESHHYDRLNIGDTSGFPDEPGYLVLGFGTAQQSIPLRFLEKVGPNLLLIDFNHAMAHDYPAGSTVTLLSGRGPFVPANPAESFTFYLTGSTAGRVAAQATAAAAAAAGIKVDFDVVYPGDRGLGGESYPTEGNGKLSDITEVFGGDNLDKEA